MIARALVLAGSAVTILSAFVTWVTVTGLNVTLDLDLISADVGAANRTVAGTDTVLWPALVAAGAIAAVLARWWGGSVRSRPRVARLGA